MAFEKSYPPLVILDDARQHNQVSLLVKVRKVQTSITRLNTTRLSGIPQQLFNEYLSAAGMDVGLFGYSFVCLLALIHLTLISVRLIRTV